jgi:protein TonB
MKMKTIFFLAIFLSVSFAQEGLIKSYYPNDSLKSEINFSRNIRDGEAKFYFENGKIKEEVNYINGRVDGLVKQYDENGKLKEQFTLENGKREGPTSYFDDNGIWVADKDFTEGKRVIEEQPVEEVPGENTEIATIDKTPEKTIVDKSRGKKTEEMLVPPAIKEDNYEDDPAYYLSAEVMPEPIGGIAQLQKKLVYPTYAREHDIEGTVQVRTFIDQNGDVTKAEVESGIGYGCDDVARITILYTKFSPGLIRGKPVKTQLVIPLEFKLDHSN